MRSHNHHLEGMKVRRPLARIARPPHAFPKSAMTRAFALVDPCRRTDTTPDFTRHTARGPTGAPVHRRMNAPSDEVGTSSSATMGGCEPRQKRTIDPDGPANRPLALDSPAELHPAAATSGQVANAIEPAVEEKRAVVVIPDVRGHSAQHVRYAPVGPTAATYAGRRRGGERHRWPASSEHLPVVILGAPDLKLPLADCIDRLADNGRVLVLLSCAGQDERFAGCARVGATGRPRLLSAAASRRRRASTSGSLLPFSQPQRGSRRSPGPAWRRR